VQEFHRAEYGTGAVAGNSGFIPIRNRFLPLSALMRGRSLYENNGDNVTFAVGCIGA
jgi:hypothetical protein